MFMYYEYIVFFFSKMKLNNVIESTTCYDWFYLVGWVRGGQIVVNLFANCKMKKKKL